MQAAHQTQAFSLSPQEIFYKAWKTIKADLNKQGLVGEFYIHNDIPNDLDIDFNIVENILLNLALNAIEDPQCEKIIIVITWIKDGRKLPYAFQPTKSFHYQFLSSLKNQNKNFESFQCQFEDLLEESIVNENTYIPSERPEGTYIVNRKIDPISKRLLESIHSISKHYEKLSSDQEPEDLTSGLTDEWEDREHKLKGIMKIEVFYYGYQIHHTMAKNLVPVYETETQMTDNTECLDLKADLQLAKILCKSIKGEIKVFSEEGKGSQIVALIPAESRTGIDLSPEPKELNVMIVEDIQFNVMVLEYFLKEAGGVKIQAVLKNGQEAVDVFTSKPEGYFDFVIINWMMPVMDGPQAVRKIRRFEQENQRLPIKIIMVSVSFLPEDIDRFLNPTGDIRADAVYEKPYTPEAIEGFLEIARGEYNQVFV